jgi:hypothetical protein
MDAYLVSDYIKKSLQKKKNIEHADFLAPTVNNTPVNNTPDNNTPSNNNSIPENGQYVDNSINDYSTNVTNVTNIIEEDGVGEDEEELSVDSSASKISTGTFILMLLINSYAAYLSWDCNTSKNYPLMLKVLFSLFAFMFGSLYIVYYILFKFDDCNQFKPE